jgi:hypothetical protein
MSPEQVAGDPIDHRSDIFAAGILLYEALVAKRLFKGETDLDTLERVRSAIIAPLPSEENKRVTPEVDKIVLKALSLDPKDRYQTAGEFHDALADQLYSTGKRMDSKTLAKFMSQLFSKEIKEEEEKDKERSSPDIPVFQPEMFYGPPTPTPAAPLTRPDLPAGVTPGAVKRPMSSLAIGFLATLIILLVAGGVVGVYWYLNRPQPFPRADAGAAKPPAPRLGTLSISSQPHGADILVNDQPTKLKTPALVHELDRKKLHTVKLALKGHKPWSKQVQFGNMEMVALDAQLTPLPKKPPKPPPPPPRPRFGTLNINAVPVWAYVHINGKRQPKPTPIYNLRLRPGTYEIRLENPKLKLVKVKKVTIKKGKSVNLVVKMK